jgi:ParB-like chromosome segregation protein Spo0J
MTETLKTGHIILVDQITASDSCQPRAKVSEDLVEEYTEAMREGSVFPPIVLFFDSDQQTYFLADGFHRLAAAKRAKHSEILAEVKIGSLRDAVVYSCQANTGHGLRRTNADKRRAVQKFLDDPEWKLWSNREIARRCHVGESLVRTMRSGASKTHPRRKSKQHKEKQGAAAPELRQEIQRLTEEVQRLQEEAAAQPKAAPDCSLPALASPSLPPSEAPPLSPPGPPRPDEKGETTTSPSAMTALLLACQDQREALERLRDENKHLADRVATFQGMEAQVELLRAGGVTSESILSVHVQERLHEGKRTGYRLHLAGLPERSITRLVAAEALWHLLVQTGHLDLHVEGRLPGSLRFKQPFDG